MATLTQTQFDLVDIDELHAMDGTDRDALPYGVIGLDADLVAIVYNATEAGFAGVRPERVIGAPFFENSAQCMNNFMVAQRFADEPVLDAIIPYVLTLRMRPTKVRLRLLARPDVPLRFLLIER